MQMVEIAQFEEAQVRDDLKHDIDHLTNCFKLLLDEREHEINLAKTICLEYDENNEHWARVIKPSSDIDELKNEIVVLQKKKTEVIVSKTGNSMATKFLANGSNIGNSVTSDMDSSYSRKRSSEKVVEVNNDSIIYQSPSKGKINLNDD